MYIETSYPRKKGDKARFISPTYAPVKGGQCFQFWYHMYGQDIGSLNVYIKTGGNLSNPLWTRSGNRGNVWKVTQVSITASSSFNIVFEGIAGKSYQGDIAIDDLKLIKSPCPYPGDYCFSFNLNELVDHPLSNVVSEKLRSTPSENKRLYSRL